MQKHSPAENLYALFYAVQKKLNDTAASYWSALEIYNWLNNGQLYIANKSRCLKKTVTITTTASTSEYDLRTTTNDFSDIIDIADDGVEFMLNGSTRQPLTFKPVWRLNKEFPGWRGVSASVPQFYYYDKSTKTIGLYPKPNSSNAGAYLFITGYHKPKIINAGTAQSGSTSTIKLAAGSTSVPYPNPGDDYYNNLYIEIYSGAGAGQTAKITDYVGSTLICTASFTTAPDSTSIYGMLPEVPETFQYLIKLYALWKALSKGGSRVNLANNYRSEFFDGLNLAMDEYNEDDAEFLIKDSYR